MAMAAACAEVVKRRAGMAWHSPAAADVLQALHMIALAVGSWLRLGQSKQVSC
jgi:hypothetical protein